MAKKTNYYFETFIKMIDFSCQASKHLHETLENFSVDSLSEHRKIMHTIEHTEDMLRHEMMEQLAKEFVTPIEREDIIELANSLDTVTDKIEDILIHIYMYNITTIPPEALALSSVIMKCCEALKVAMEEFPNFRKSSILKDYFIKVDDLEDEGDLLYINAIHELFKERKGTSVDTMVWSKLFACFEECCDTCSEVVSIMEMIVMKNS